MSATAEDPLESSPPLRQRWSRVLSRRLSSLLDRLRPSQTTLLLITAVVVGGLTGLAAVLFIRLIEIITGLGFGDCPELIPGLGRGWLIVIPALGGLLAGPIIARWAPEARGHGVPEVMQSLAMNGGRIRPRVAVAKIAASSICIGSGGSAGREGPIVQVGSTLGSTLGQLLRLSEERVRNLVACGAAAGVAATFNAPIAGVAFAMEVLAGDLGLGLLSNVVISAVTASVVSQAFLGSDPAFPVPAYSLNDPRELLLYVGLGAVAALLGILFIRTLYRSEDLFERQRRIPPWLRPALGGLLLGALAFLYPMALSALGVSPELAGNRLPISENIPHIFGSGFESIGVALGGPLPALLLAALLLMKLLATSFTLGSGNSGGVFAPSLFLGGMLGGLFGLASNALFPGVAPHPGAYALAGMAAVFAASARAPLTAILIAFEMSNDYGMILSLMAATITATVIAGRLHPESIYTLKLVRRGIRLRRGRDVDVLDGVRVQEIMYREPATVESAMELRALQGSFIDTHRQAVLVLDEDRRLAGIVTVRDLERAKQSEGWEPLPVAAVMVRTLLTAFPDETMGSVIERMAVRDVGRLPVVERGDPSRLLGIIRREDIARAYRRGRLQRQAEADLGRQAGIGAQSGTELLELRVAPHSQAAGRRVRELTLPPEVLLTTRRRGTEQKLLGGDDLLCAGDTVLALAKPQSAARLRAIFEEPGEA